MKTSGTCSEDELLRELRHVLRHLYDPDVLRASPLTRLLPVDPEDASTALREILIKAIQALKPSPNVSRQSSAWRTYYTLTARYIQQFPQAEVARALGVSTRQMRRQDNLALRMLLDYLHGQYGLLSKLHSEPLTAEEQCSGSPNDLVPLSREEELHWVQQSQSAEEVNFYELVRGLLKTVQPLATRANVEIIVHVPESLPTLFVQAAALRQALLTVLTAFIRQVPGGRVTIAAEACGGQLFVRMVPYRSSAAVSYLPECNAGGCLEVARQLVELTGGELQVHSLSDQSGLFVAEMIYSIGERPVVLVVDDNRDALQLFERYLAGSRFAFVGTAEPEQALDLAERCKPQIIVLDIMLPRVDGWEILERLREHPQMRHIPIVVSTILPQQELALALGAAAFVQKPVSRATLLSVLEEQLARTYSAPG